jgi:hypothetical protein
MTAKLLGLLELQLKLKIDFLLTSMCSKLYIFGISNNNLLSANFRSDLTSARIDKFSTKLC